MAHAKNTNQWGRETARERYACGGMADGGVPADPESDRYDPGRSGPAYSKGSQGALQEALRSKQAESRRKDPSVNVGQGPTPTRAQQWEENRQWREMHPQSGVEDYKRGGKAK